MAKEEKKPRGRPSSFDRQEVLEKVMNLFWERGYNHISFNEIALETGLTRASLYNSFQTKEALFLEALELYFKKAPDSVLRDLKKGDPIGPAFYAVFKNAAKMYGTDPKKRGCMGVNCMSELMGRQGDLNEKIGELYEGYKKHLKGLIKQAINQNELPKGTDAEITANMIFAFMNGLSVFSKSKSSNKQLENIARDFLQKLGFNLEII